MQAYEGDVPGASLLVLHEGEAVVRRAYGYADLEHRVAASHATNYRLASLTKQFTAATVLLLVEESRLRLDASIRTWLPSLPAVADRVTLRHLLTHTSGVLDYEDLIPASRRDPLHDADVLQLLESADRTYFPPGTSYRYSNSGYALLALAVAVAAGMDFASVLRTRIFAPLGMHHTVAHEEGISTVSHRAFGYSERQRRWLRTDQNLTSAVLGDGGIYSSADDWEKWDAALSDDRLLTTGVVASRLHGGDCHRRSVGRLWVWVANHQRACVALGRVDRVPQRRGAFPRAPFDGAGADEPR